MSKKEFASLFPEVKPRGAKRYPGGTVEVLELLVDEYSFIPSGHKKRNPLTGMESTVTWFYFYNNKLIQYGQPQDWPAEPDTIIEVR
ncbi:MULTISPECIES: hypothetical protein [Gammaproteobacteria]|uniref:hypothetical protein n=1 Tax=Gammaproteobacteria TaxID=1236 RepID=UPI001ADD0B44|nr:MULTISPECIES: hypothetical protein [Gammaproteobacteria]MBO9484502.1 hypothetical protein [Salinisphaera sp. G21_0]MBO9497620.1 hypothetical protein [Thalassotalea sp. G20_0]